MHGILLYPVINEIVLRWNGFRTGLTDLHRSYGMSLLKEILFPLKQKDKAERCIHLVQKKMIYRSLGAAELWVVPDSSADEDTGRNEVP